MCPQKLRRLTQRRLSLVKHGRIGLEHVRHAGHDLERDRHVRLCGPSGEANRVAEEDLVGADLEQQGGSPLRSPKMGLMYGSRGLAAAT